MPAGRPKGIPKTGGRKKGVGNRPKPIILTPDELAQNRAIAIVTPAEVRTPKAVMLSAMMKFERMSDVLMAKAERMTAEEAAYEDIKQVVAEAHKFTFAAVNCADRVAPYVHARLIAVESRDKPDQVPFVVRVPAVISDSSAWQAATGAGLADLEPMPHSALPSAPVAAVRAPDPLPAVDVGLGTARLPVKQPQMMPKPPNYMPPGPSVVSPAGSEAWLASVKKVG